MKYQIIAKDGRARLAEMRMKVEEQGRLDGKRGDHQ
jgi:hypothetical protein